MLKSLSLRLFRRDLDRWQEVAKKLEPELVREVDAGLAEIDALLERVDARTDELLNECWDYHVRKRGPVTGRS